MNASTTSITRISYKSTERFSRLVERYLAQDEQLHALITSFPSKEALLASIETKAAQLIDRELLVATLRDQYQSFSASDDREPLLKRLASPRCFTITTAHQPNILGGPLYFIYKIIHAIKLAEYCKEQFPAYDFLPVFWMGSEDADLDELGHLYIGTEKKVWHTVQTGPVGRMHIDDSFLQLRDAVCAEMAVKPHGLWLSDIIQRCYTQNRTIASTTQQFVHQLFGREELLVLDPDYPALKQAFVPIMARELKEQFSANVLTQTAQRFPADLPAQALGRPINLFYLQDQRRDRIEQDTVNYVRFPHDTPQSQANILKELHDYPERFSPNVVLRPVYQETILPNIAFVGGGGELAYWMQLKDVFRASQLPFPILIVRHSIMLMEEQATQLARHFGLEGHQLFQEENTFRKQWVENQTPGNLQLEEIRKQLRQIYRDATEQAAKQDPTLQDHTERLAKQAEKKLIELEKKMFRAAKRKLEADMRKMDRLWQSLFPLNNLQERVHSNLMYLAKYGPSWLQYVKENMPEGLDDTFTILPLHQPG